MTRYIDAEALTAEFKRLTLGENSLIERIFADGVYAVIDTFPTADVVPKSEVDNLIKVIDNTTQQFLELHDLYQNAKSEVAREIFEEITRKVYSKIPDKILPVTFGEMSRHLDYSDGLNFGSRNAYFDTLKIIAELKKKYTEE